MEISEKGFVRINNQIIQIYFLYKENITDEVKTISTYGYLKSESKYFYEIVFIHPVNFEKTIIWLNKENGL